MLIVIGLISLTIFLVITLDIRLQTGYDIVMKFKITGQHLPDRMTTASTVMTAVSLDRMMGKENRDKLDLRLRFKHHHSEGGPYPTINTNTMLL